MKGNRYRKIVVFAFCVLQINFHFHSQAECGLRCLGLCFVSKQCLTNMREFSMSCKVKNFYFVSLHKRRVFFCRSCWNDLVPRMVFNHSRVSGDTPAHQPIRAFLHRTCHWEIRLHRDDEGC